MSVPRGEYPRPQFVRQDWLCLNGEWEFEIDGGDSGYERNLHLGEQPLAQRITVPFCPESALSGIENVDFMPAVWYRRVVHIPAAWEGKRVVLHFGAVDYDTTVWVDGKEVYRHRGGYTSWNCDLKGMAEPGTSITLVVRARDPNDESQPRGKQSSRYSNYSVFYTRTTGIWQTVWMEPVPECYLRRTRITPDAANGMIRLEQPLSQNRPGYTLRATLSDEGGMVVAARCRADLDLAPRLDLAIPPDRQRLWSPDDPFLYDLEIELLDAEGAVEDRWTSYAGLRSVAISGNRVLLNGEPVFQRLVLDQGFYADGIMTAPTDQALVDDIRLSMAAGFNGARLHQKVFEERYLHHADRLGYLVWGEFADWGCSGGGPEHDNQDPPITYVAQWLEALERDYAHPSIIGWCGLNETSQGRGDRITELDDATRAMFLAAKALDSTRPVLDASGFAHRVPESDIYDAHDYIQEPDWEEGLKHFRELNSAVPEADPCTNPAVDHVEYAEQVAAGEADPHWSIPYRGQPYWVSEWGGFRWDGAPPDDPNSTNGTSEFGYGSAPTSEEDWMRRFEAVSDILRGNPDMFGYCYTQLTDTFQEVNGVYFFDRRPKFDIERLRGIQCRPAAIENAERRAQSAEQSVERRAQNAEQGRTETVRV